MITKQTSFYKTRTKLNIDVVGKLNTPEGHINNVHQSNCGFPRGDCTMMRITKFLLDHEVGVWVIFGLVKVFLVLC